MPLSRERVLAAAVELADRRTLDAVNMRSLAAELGVVPMALYKHIAGKEELLDGMVDQVVGEIGPAAPSSESEPAQVAVRERILAARRALVRHPWAARLIDSRPAPTPAMLGYTDGLIALLLADGLTPDLAHHAMHALGGRMWGLTHEVAPSPSPADPAEAAARLAQLAAAFPHVAVVAAAGGGSHDPSSVLGSGCDDQFEFEFALDLLLDGFWRLHRAGWHSAAVRS